MNFPFSCFPLLFFQDIVFMFDQISAIVFASRILFNTKTVKSLIKGGIYSVKYVEYNRIEDKEI